VTSLVILEFQAILRPVVTGIQGLGIDEWGGNTFEFGSLRSGQLLVPCNSHGQEASHIVDETTRMGGELDLNSVSDLAESIRFQKLMLTAKILADGFRLSHFDLAPQGGPTFGEVGERTGHLKVVHVDNQDEPELGMEEAAGPIFDWFPAALSGSSVERLLPVPP
jgi:hypothetical protein